MSSNKQEAKRNISSAFSSNMALEQNSGEKHYITIFISINQSTMFS